MKKQIIFVFPIAIAVMTTTVINAQKIEIVGDGTSSRELSIQNEQINSNAHTYASLVNASDQWSTSPLFEGQRSRGTLDMPTDVSEGDRTLGLLSAQYIDGIYRFSTSIEFWAGPEPSTVSFPSEITFSTTSPGETSREERLRIDGYGRLGILTDLPKSQLHIAEGDIYIENITNGVIMTSPDGTCWRYTPDNSGALVGTSIACPN
ncbi:MAG: hypothetical protein HKN51_03720 [Saprospiraceae bacterium]|nr:hypothetical protein [Saprospiraceae bacterium]